MQPSCCWILALGMYFASNPSLIPGKLFPGSNQKARFCKDLGKMLKEITGQKIYGTHSIRKGVVTYASSGSTVSPSIVSICLRCGWSLGGVQDRYFRYEAAGDQYLGRVVTGMPQNNSQFAALPPHFTDPTDVLVLDNVFQMFPSMKNDARIAPVLHLCLAPIVQHAEYVRINVAQTHPILLLYAFRDTSVMDRLQSKLSTTQNSWMQSTGIPPHIELLQQHSETQNALQRLPDVLLDGFGKLLQERSIGQNNITRDTLGSTIRLLLQEAGLWKSQGYVEQSNSSNAAQRIAHYWPSDGKFHQMPADFQFPQVNALRVWRLWWLGNQTAGYPPFRTLHACDFSAANRKMYSEWSVLVRHINSGVEASGHVEMQRPVNQEQADRLYHFGISKLHFKPSKHPHKQRPERAVTTLRRIRQAIHDSDPEARSVPHRKRKTKRALACS